MFYLSFTGLFAAPPSLNRHTYLDSDGSFSLEAISEYMLFTVSLHCWCKNEYFFFFTSVSMYIRCKQFAFAHYIVYIAALTWSSSNNTLILKYARMLRVVQSAINRWICFAGFIKVKVKLEFQSFTLWSIMYSFAVLNISLLPH